MEMGFKNRLIRINNELNFRLLNHSSASDIIVGKSDIIFPESYITSFLGKDFVGKESIENFLTLTKTVQDSLEARGKFFFILIAPGKASVYQDEIPDSYFEKNYGEYSNYDVFIPSAEAKGVHVLDLRKHILNQKSEFKYPIFPQFGLHWSGYTISQVGDTLLSYIAEGSGRNLPKVQLEEGIITSVDYRWTDYDIGETMNLYWHASDQLLAYPKMTFKEIPKSKPSIIGVGDSFLQSFYGFYPILDSAFSTNSQLWYYNKIIDWPLKFQALNIKPEWLNMDKEISETDVILLEMTEENIRQLGYGFVEDLDDYFNQRIPKKEDNIELYEKLWNDDQLGDRATELHELLGYSYEEMLHQLVIYQLKNKWLLDFDFDREVELVKKSIYSDLNWLNSIKEKAIKNNLSLEEAVHLDAVWMVNEKLAGN